LRMSTQPVPPGFGQTAEAYLATLHAEEDTYYWNLMPDGEGQDHYLWGDRLSPSTAGLQISRDFDLDLNNIAAQDGLSAEIRVQLKGYTSLGHRTKVFLNGTEIADLTWSGQEFVTIQQSLDHALLNDSGNMLRVETVDIGVIPDQILVNWIEVDYWDQYHAENNELKFGAPSVGTFTFNVVGFNSSDIKLFDVSDPENVIWLSDYQVQDDFTLAFTNAADLSTSYYAMTTARLKTPVSIVLDQPSSLKSAENGADYILITHEDFYTSAVALTEHRSGQGYRAVAVDVEDIYDEFNYGIFNPKAIRDFLLYAYTNWMEPAPTHVVLLGDAYQDYKDNLNSGSVNYVPTQIVETELFGQCPSDNWFVSISGDDILPDMFIGRLSARTSEEAEAIIDKIINYDVNRPSSSWNSDVLLVADDDESDFKTISEALANQLPYYYSSNKVYVGDYPGGDPTVDITSFINNGSILTSYAGHGEYFRWGRWNNNQDNIYEVGDLESLSNVDKLTVVTAANCVNGFFSTFNDRDTIAESFQRLPDKGAVAVWAPGSTGYPSGHRILMGEFYKSIFQFDQDQLGVATNLALNALYAESELFAELVETYILFGDPATRIGIPTNYPYVESTTPTDGSQAQAGQPIVIRFYKPMDPATVDLQVAGPGNLTFTPSWNEDYTEVSYSHTGFVRGETFTATISGQDLLGNDLGDGLVPNSWSFTIAIGEVYLPFVNHGD